MPRGGKGKYTGKQKRKAHKIEEGYEKRGVSSKEAARRAYATVNKEEGGWQEEQLRPWQEVEAFLFTEGWAQRRAQAARAELKAA